MSYFHFDVLFGNWKKRCDGQFFMREPFLSQAENILSSLPSSAFTLRLLLGLYCCLWRTQEPVSEGSFLNSVSNCTGGVQVHDKPADDSEQGNRYKERLPRGAACSLVGCQRLPWMDHKVCPHSRTYGDNVKKTKTDQNNNNNNNTITNKDKKNQRYALWRRRHIHTLSHQPR